MKFGFQAAAQLQNSSVFFRARSLSALFQLIKRAFSGELRCIAQRSLDAQQLIILGDAVASAGCAGLDLPGIHGDGDIRDGRILRLARAMGDDGGVSGLFRNPDRYRKNT